MKSEIDMGRMERPASCSSCGGGGAIEAHHEDYGRPLDVTWLCRSCHRLSHRKYGSF